MCAPQFRHGCSKEIWIRPQQHSEIFRLCVCMWWSRHKEHCQMGCLSKGPIVWRTELVTAGHFGLKCGRIPASLNQRILLQILAANASCRCHGISTKPAWPFITWPALCCDSGSGSRCEIDLSVRAWSCWCNGLWNAAAILWPSAEWQSSAEQRNLLCMWQLLCLLRLVTQHCLRVQAKRFCLFYLFLSLCLFLPSPPFSSPRFYMQSHLSLLRSLK